MCGGLAFTYQQYHCCQIDYQHTTGTTHRQHNPPARHQHDYQRDHQRDPGQHDPHHNHHHCNSTTGVTINCDWHGPPALDQCTIKTTTLTSSLARPLGPALTASTSLKLEAP